MKSLPHGVKRGLSIALFASLVFFGARIFRVERAECDLHFKMKEAAARTVREIDLRLLENEGGELLGKYRKLYEHGSGPSLGRWNLTIASGTYWIEGVVVTEDGAHPVGESVSLEDGESVSLYLDRYLQK